MNKFFKLLLIPFSLIILYVVSTGFISIIYAEVFEFNEEDYYASDQSISEKNPANSEDIDKENCINTKSNLFCHLMVI